VVARLQHSWVFKQISDVRMNHVSSRRIVC
jgi:hypothetical protein